MRKNPATIFAVGLALTACSLTAHAVETWLTGTLFVGNGVLLFRTDAPIEGNTGGPVVKLGTSRNATNLLPVLQAAAEKRMILRLYGDIAKDNTVPPGYSGEPLPNISFVIWKMHMPNEKDTWDPGQKPKNLRKDDVLIDNGSGKVVASQPAGTGYGELGNPAIEVPKKSALRRAIILGVRDSVYNNNRRLSIENPRHIDMTFSHFLCDGKDAAVKLTKLTADGPFRDPSPLLLFLRQNEAGDWYIYKQVQRVSQQELDYWTARGWPKSLFP